jgi:Ca2+-transporting ATPase
VFTLDTFASTQMNVIALAELVLTFLAFSMNGFNRLLGTVQIDAQQFGLALVAALGLLSCWEIGKWIARRTLDTKPRVEASEWPGKTG